MATFQVRVEDYTGTIGDTAAISDWLTTGAKIITDRFKPEKLELWATDKTDAGSGIAITGGRALLAHKSGYPAIRVSVAEKGRMADSSSIYKAATTSPVWYVDSTKAYVLPSGGIIKWFAYPTVAFGDATISNYPSEAYGAVVLYAAVQGETRIITDLIDTTMAAVAWSAPTVITAPAAPSFAWIDAAIGTYTATVLGVTATPPSYTKPTQTFDVTQFETFLETNVDVEPAGIQLGRLNFELGEFGADIQNELNEFNKEDKVYQGKIQQEIKQADLTQTQILKLATDTTELNKFNELQTLAEQVQEYQAVLSKHQSDVANYASQVNREASRIGSAIQQYTSMYTGYFQLLKNLKEEYSRALEVL